MKEHKKGAFDDDPKASLTDRAGKAKEKAETTAGKSMNAQ